MYKCPQFADEDFINDESDEEPEPIFEQADISSVENLVPASEQPGSDFNNPNIVRGSWPNRIDSNQKSGIVKMLDNVASSLIFITRPICALSSKVQILKSYLQNL